jgi:hypothetical protein
LGTATRGSEGVAFPLLVSPDASPRTSSSDFSPSEIIAAVAAAAGVCPNQGSRRRPKGLSHARRAALVLWSHTGRPRSIMARALGVASSTATRLSQTATPGDVELNEILAKALHVLNPPP